MANNHNMNEAIGERSVLVWTETLNFENNKGYRQLVICQYLPKSFQEIGAPKPPHYSVLHGPDLPSAAQVGDIWISGRETEAPNIRVLHSSGWIHAPHSSQHPFHDGLRLDSEFGSQPEWVTLGTLRTRKSRKRAGVEGGHPQEVKRSRTHPHKATSTSTKGKFAIGQLWQCLSNPLQARLATHLTMKCLGLALKPLPRSIYHYGGKAPVRRQHPWSQVQP